MSVASMNAGAELRIGNVLSRALEICGANVLLFGAVSLAVSLPTLIYTPQTTLTEWSYVDGFIFLFSIVVSLFLNTVGEAVILFGAFQYLRGQPVVPADALRKSLARFLPIIGFAILYAIAFFFGLLLLIVPGIILFIMWTVALPACVVEGLGPIDCMRRSAELTKGYRWKIFWIMVVLTIVGRILGGIFEGIAAQGGDVAKTVIDLIWTAAWSAYWNCVLVMIYHDLRVVKEGIDTAQIASIFD